MSAGGLASALDALGQFAAKRRRVETCEMCAAELAQDHPHLVDPKARKLLCSCLACALLFGSQAGSKYKRVPRRIRYLAGFRLTDAEWESLMIPINMAFFFKSSPEGRVVAQYPSPAGATESQLSLDRPCRRESGSRGNGIGCGSPAGEPVRSWPRIFCRGVLSAAHR